MRLRFALTLLLAGLSLQPATVHASDRKAAEALLVDGVNIWRKGEIAQGKGKLLEAIKSDADWTLPHAALAGMMLATGDGYGAEAEAKRAQELGMKSPELTQLYAHAYLLQGNAQRALDTAKDAAVAPKFKGYAARVRGLALKELGDATGAGRELDLAANLNPRSSAIWADIAHYRVSNGNQIGAIEAAAKSTQLNPYRADTLSLMGTLVRGQFGLTAAIPWFRRALDIEPGNIAIMRELAATLGDAGQTVEMLSVTRQMLDLDPVNADAFYLQAVLAARAKKFDLARTLLYRTQGKLDKVPAVMLLTASLELQSGAAEQAIARLEDLVKEQPGNLKAQRLLGAALWRAGDNDLTIKALERIANRPDADSYTLSVIGRAYEAEGRLDSAAPYLDRAAQPVRGDAIPFEMGGDLVRLAKASVGPSDNAEFAVPYINQLVLAGRADEALAHAQRLRAMNPGAPAAHVLVGDALVAQGRHAEAAEAFKGAAAIRFNEPVALRLIEALGKSGKRAEALRVLDLFLSQNPRSVPGLLLASEHFLVSGQWDRAIEVLDGLRFRLGDRDATVLHSLGWAWFNKGKTDKAIELTGAAYGMVPSNPAFANSYGWILYKSGRNKEGGTALLEKAVATAPNHPGLRYHLGQALIGVGRKDEAKVHLRMAAGNPEFPDAKAAEKLLSSL